MRPGSRRSPPGGFSLAELVAAMGIAVLLGAVLGGVLLAQLRLARHTAQRVLAADARRTTALILAGELRRILPADLRALTPDSLALRAFRGFGIVCTVTGTVVRVRYRGDRLPAPSKDSILVLGAAAPVAAALEATRRIDESTCVHSGGGVALEWDLSAPPPDAAILLLFESGSYHLSGRALRYRIGAGGRQPLTPETFSHPATRFSGHDERALRFMLSDGAAHREYAPAFAPPAPRIHADPP